VTRQWFESWFGEEYIALYPHRDAAEAERAVDLIARNVPAGHVSRVLDLACGGGRHASLLSRHWRTIGLDLSAVLLRLAKGEAPEARFVRGDMRVLPFRPDAFSLVVNLFTSFGYFEEDASHERVVREVARVIEPGGTFVLDFLNTERIRQTLVAYDERRIGDQVVEQRREISDDGRFVIKRICVRNSNREYAERVRLFDKQELMGMFDASGFRVAKSFGNYDGSPATAEAPRVILFGTRQ